MVDKESIGVYGENLPADAGEKEHGIREETAERDPAKGGDDEIFDRSEKSSEEGRP